MSNYRQEAPPNPPYTRRYAYDASGNVEYEGWAVPGTPSSAAGWVVRRYTYTAGALTLTEIAAGGAMNQVWDDYASLTYA